MAYSGPIVLVLIGLFIYGLVRIQNWQTQRMLVRGKIARKPLQLVLPSGTTLGNTTAVRLCLQAAGLEVFSVIEPNQVNAGIRGRWNRQPITCVAEVNEQSLLLSICNTTSSNELRRLQRILDEIRCEWESQFVKLPDSEKLAGYYRSSGLRSLP